MTIPKGRSARPRAPMGSSAGLPDDDASGARMRLLSRRGFLQGSGAALALSFLSLDGCTRKEASGPSGSLTAFPVTSIVKLPMTYGLLATFTPEEFDSMTVKPHSLFR